MQNHVIVSEKESYSIIKKYNVKDIIDLKNGNFFIYYDLDIEDKDVELNKNNSVSISAAITAYGRMYMSQFKNEFTLYSDTDSLDSTEKLDEK